LPGNNAMSKNSWKICQELSHGKLLAKLSRVTPHKISGKMHGGNYNSNGDILIPLCS